MKFRKRSAFKGVIRCWQSRIGTVVIVEQQRMDAVRCMCVDDAVFNISVDVSSVN